MWVPPFFSLFLSSYALSPSRTYLPGPPDVVAAVPAAAAAAWTPEPWSDGETSTLSTPGSHDTSVFAVARSASALAVTHGGNDKPTPLLSLRLGARRTLPVSDHAAAKECFTARDASTAARESNDGSASPNSSSSRFSRARHCSS
jgi:hypothetical protein